MPRKLGALASRGKWVLVSLPVASPAGVHRGARWVIDPDDAMSLMYPGGGGIGTLPGTVVLKGRGEPKPDRGPPLACPIERWDAEEASRRIELHVGRDLQFIRINGTVVGSLAGLVIYTVAQLLF